MITILLVIAPFLVLGLVGLSYTNFSLFQLPSKFKSEMKGRDGESEESSEIDELLDRYPILAHYQKFDRIRSVPEDVMSGRAKPSEDNSPIVYTFIAITDDLEVIVYKGDLEGGEEEMKNNPQDVEKITIKELLEYENLQARLRKEKLEGAENICKAMNSSAEKERQKELEKRAALKGMDPPCEVVDSVMEEIRANGEDLPDKLPSADSESSDTSHKFSGEKQSIHSIEDRCMKVLGWLEKHDYSLDTHSVGDFSAYDLKRILKTPEDFHDEEVEELLDLIEAASIDDIVTATEISDGYGEFRMRLEEKVMGGYKSVDYHHCPNF